MAPLFDHLFGLGRIADNVAAADDLQRSRARRVATLPQLALRWTTASPGVSTSLVGCRTVAEVEDDVGALGWTIDDADLRGDRRGLRSARGEPVPADSWIERGL